MENPIKIDDLGVPLFSETSKSNGILQNPSKTPIRLNRRRRPDVPHLLEAFGT